MEELARGRRFHFCNLYSVFLNLIVFTEAQEGNKVDTIRCLCTGCFLLTVARLLHNLHMNQGSQSYFISFHFIFNSLDMVTPQIQGSGLQGTMLKTSI